MNILYLTPTGNIIGGGQISLLNLLEGLDKSRFKPYVVMPYEGNFTKKIKDLDIPIIILASKKIKNPLNIFYSIRTLKSLTEIIKQYRIDLVHSNLTGGVSLLAGIASRITKLGFIWHVRVINSGGILDLIQSLLSTTVIVVSKAVKRRFWWIPIKNKFALIYNGVNLERFNPSIDRMIFRREIGCSEDEFLVGTIGRYHPFKGYEYFIKAAKKVSKELPKTKFLIVGLDYHPSNKYLTCLRNLTKKLNLEDRFIFMDGREDVPQILASLDLFVLSTLEESFGRALIEAMACEKPIVAFGGGGVPEIVEDGVTGILVPPKNSEKITQAVLELLKDSEKAEKMGLSGRKRVESFFDNREKVKKIENLYLTLLRTLNKVYAKKS